MGFFDDSDTVTVERTEAPKAPVSFFDDADTTEAPSKAEPPSSFFDSADSYEEEQDPRMSGVDEVSVARGPKATEEPDTLSDDWSGWAANMMISGNRLGQGVDIARVEQISGWKKEADEAKAALDAYTSNDPYKDLSSLKKVYPTQGIAATALAEAEKARDARFEGGAVEPYHSAVKNLRDHYESRKRIFEEGAKSIPQYVQSISEKEKNIKSLEPQLSPEMKKLNESEGAEFWKTFAGNPFESLANIIGSSAVVGAPAIVGGAVGSLAGPAGTAAGSAYGSYVTETTQSLLDSIKESGVDISDPEKFQEALGNPMIMDKARQIAQARGVSVAAFDGITAGLAGRFIGPVLQTSPTVKTALAATAKEIATQMTGGGAGELTAQLAAAQDVSIKDIALEALGELGSGITETYGNVSAANRILAETAQSTPPAPIDPNSVIIPPPTLNPTPETAAPPVVTLPSGSTIVMEPGDVTTPETPAATQAPATIQIPEPPTAPVEEVIAEPTPAPSEVSEQQTSPTPQKPTDNWANVPDYVRDSLKPLWEMAERSGLADKIEDLAAQRKTTAEIAKQTGADPDFVMAVKIGRGIPSWTSATNKGGAPVEDPDFTKWLANRSQKHPTPSEPTPAPSEVPEQQTSEVAQETKKVITKDDVAEAIMPFRDQAVRLAESLGNIGNVEADNTVDDAIDALMAKVDEGDFSNGNKDLRNPRALLMSFVRNEVLDKRKSAGTLKHGGGKVISMEGQDIENAAVETKGPRQEALEKEDLEQLKKAISTFTPTERKVGLMLADDMTVEEIAEELDMAVGSVKNIRTRLAQELGPYAQRMGFGKSLGPGAASADEVLTRYEVRKIMERLEEDENLHEDLREVAGEAAYYEPIPMVQTAEEAGKLIEERGESAIAKQITDPSEDITFAQRVTIGIELITRLDNRYRKERDADPIAAKQTLEKAIEIKEWLAAYSTSLGQGVNALKFLGKRLKLNQMMEAFRSANGGAPVTRDQMDFINEIEKDTNETEERLDARIEALEEEASQTHGDLTLSDRIKENIQEKTDPLVLSIAERIGKWLQTKEDAARKRMRERLKYVGSNPDVLIAADIAIIGASKIYNGILSKVKWMQAMRADPDLSPMGEDLEQYLEPAWEDANKLLDDKVEDEAPKAKREPVKRIVKKMTGEEVRTELTKRITKEAKEGGKLEDMVPLIRRLADNFIASGIRTREGLEDALHAVIEPILPGTTKRDVRDAFSGYGRFRELSKDDVSQVRRDLSAQSQLVSKYEDITEGKPPKKSGVERTPTSDEQRRLSKLVEEAKRIHGVKVTDPARQLKSAQDAIKTRLKNEIKDMARQIETGEKPPGKSQTEWDAEIERLKEQRDRMKDVLSSLEDTKIPEETRIKNAERALEKSIEDITKRIKNKDLKTTKGAPLESEKLSVLRAQKEVLQAELDELRSADTALQEEKKFDALMKRKDELERMIASGELFPTKKDKTEDTDLVKEARALVNELQKNLRDAQRPSPEARKAQLDKAIASVESSIKALDARLQSGDLSTRESSPEVTTPELERLRAERAAMVKELNRQRREAAKPSESEVQAKKDAKQIKDLESSIAELTRKINDKDLSTKKTSKTLSPEAQKLADYKKYLNDFLNDMRRAAKPKLTKEEVAMKAFKTRTKKEILRLEEKLAKGDFAKKAPKKLDISKDPEAVKLRAQVLDVRRRFEQKRIETEKANRTTRQKILAGVRETLGLPRSLFQTTYDFSAVLRQGGFTTAGHPIMAARSLGNMFSAGWSKERAANEAAKIALRDNYTNGNYERDGLYLSEVGDPKLTRQEESMMSDFASRISEIIEGYSKKTLGDSRLARWATRIVSQPFRAAEGSQRAYVAFLNKIRADMYDVMSATLTQSGTPTPEEGKAIAKFINESTGRGTIGIKDSAAETLAQVFYSPRLVASRFQLLARPLTGFHYGGPTSRVRRMIAKEFARTMVGASAVLLLGALAGAEIEKDPRSSDFGKLKFGNTRIDPFFGLLQEIVLLTKIATVQRKDAKGNIKSLNANLKRFGEDDLAKEVFDFTRTKLAPVPGAFLDYQTGQNVVGEEVTAQSALAGLVTPMVTRDVPELMQEWGVPKTAAFHTINTFGASVQHYKDKENKQQRALEIMASPR